MKLCILYITVDISCFSYLQVKYLNVRFERELSEQSARLEDEQKRQISMIKQVKQPIN